ncbi:Mannosyl-oligosaccharide alpha-1,2-mannosidase and related glycosyl hydrolases [Ceraceosorus bombacis]|uniref:alpha-1,2-Mannosidase n=1 Tax=Ceraceosorus bombacis TaxID=401625 RepID=A0A0P1BMN6_9BASI|nr:Mannosyl-oligosaccharide alpha-1,2-mannosidase and related glycosyl hydrolases [Ceraceosorus bombacis]
MRRQGGNNPDDETPSKQPASASSGVHWGADVEKREAIKKTFIEQYQKYEQFAFGSDLLKPVARQGDNNSILAGFGGTIIDSMSTMHIMQLSHSDEYKRALEHAKQLNFSVTPEGDPVGSVSVFELTIRYIGGLLSAYHLGGERPDQRFLVDKAKELGDKLASAWWTNTTTNQRNKVPYNHFNLNLSAPVNLNDTANIAEAGSLILEWARLTKYTGNQQYLDLTDGAMKALIGLQQPLPGLPSQNFFPGNLSYTDDLWVTAGGGSDSFWEYLLKYGFAYGLDANDDYLKTWRAAADSFTNLATNTGVGNLTFMADFEPKNKTKVYVTSHLASWIGGGLAMGGALFGNETWVQIGGEIAESHARTYNATATRLGPEVIGYFDDHGIAKGWDFVSVGRREFYNEHGFFIGSAASYIQRPETIESLFYLYRITGQQIFRDYAWEAYLAMKKYLDTGNGWLCLVNVNDLSSSAYDEAQTFLFAETLKYLYLMWDDPETWSLDDYYFTTEGHVFQVAKRNPAFKKIQQSGSYTPLAPAGSYKNKGVNPEEGKGALTEGQEATILDGVRAAAASLRDSLGKSMPLKVAIKVFSGIPRNQKVIEKTYTIDGDDTP